MLTFCLFPICMTFGFIKTDTGYKALQFMFRPKLEDFYNLSIWCYALGYVCNLYGLGFGVPMELAASNPFNYAYLLQDIIIQVVVGVILSLFVGFSITLHAAKIATTKDIQIRDIGYTVESVFLVIMDGLSDNPLPQVCLILFFIFFFITSLNTLLFQLDLAESQRKLFYSTIVSCLHDFTDLSPTVPVQLFFENLGSSKQTLEQTLTSNLPNLICYLSFIQYDHTVAWAQVFTPLESFFRSLSLLTVSKDGKMEKMESLGKDLGLNNIGDVMKLAVYTMKMNGINNHRSILDPISKVVSYAIQFCTFHFQVSTMIYDT